MKSPRTIRWIIAHYPVHLFIRTAEKFKIELEKACPGEFDLEIHTMSDYVRKYNKFHEFNLTPPDISGLEYADEAQIEDNEDRIRVKVKQWSEMKPKWESLFEGLESGDFEISQTQINIIGTYKDKNFHAVDLPFLFEDHDHVSRVLDGDIGDSLCANLAKNTGIRGLAFTYSGGYRVIGSKQRITNLSELATSKLLTATAHSNNLFDSAGLNTISRKCSDDSLGDLATDDNSSIETTYLRFSGKHVLKTNHSMFTTTILTGSKFWDTLTLTQQDAFMKVAKIVARAEREWSVADAEKYELDAKAKGINIVDISEEDRKLLQKSSEAIYSNIGNTGIDVDLVNSIIAKRSKH